jgi:hypothetical protein
VLEEFFGCNDHLFLLMIHSADNLPGGILPQCAKYARRSHASSPVQQRRDGRAI